MALTYDTLLDVVPTQFASFGFHTAEPYAENASEYFDSLVKPAVNSGHAWTGEGQPQAGLVMRSNSLALQIAKSQMHAGMTAMTALSRAISKAQQEVTKIVSDLHEAAEGTGFYIYVNPDGGVNVHPLPESGGGYGNLTILQDKAETAALQIYSAVNYAQSADLTARDLLTRILNTRPSFTTNASAQTLAYNSAVGVVANTNLNLANLSLEAWDQVDPLDWRPIDPDDWSLRKAIVSALGLDPDEWDLDSVAKELGQKGATTALGQLPGGGPFTLILGG